MVIVSVLWCFRIQRISGKYGFLVLVSLLVACAPIKKSELRSFPTGELCSEYARDNVNQPNVKAVLSEDNLVRGRYWSYIDRDELRVGMNECEALAVYGKPDDKKTIISILGRRQKWIWNDRFNGSQNESEHAYFKDGVITSLGRFR